MYYDHYPDNKFEPFNLKVSISRVFKTSIEVVSIGKHKINQINNESLT